MEALTKSTSLAGMTQRQVDMLSRQCTQLGELCLHPDVVSSKYLNYLLQFSNPIIQSYRMHWATMVSLSTMYIYYVQSPAYGH